MLLKRLNPRILVSTVILIGLVSVFYRAPPGTSLFRGSTHWTLEHPTAEAHNVEHRLQAMLQTPLAISDFASMGDRMSEFSALSEATVADPDVSSEPLIALLRQQFPWWNLEKTRTAPWALPLHPDTGIVTCVGDKDSILAAHLIETLRKVLHSTLPIEIAYAGDADLPAKTRNNLRALDDTLEFINLHDFYDESIAGLQNGRYAMKPFAMLASRFRNVILADADVVFLEAPDAVFANTPSLSQTGTLFWHDRAYVNDGPFSRRDWVEELMKGRQPSPSLNKSLFWQHDLWQEMDSGVVCIDKGNSKAFMGLLFATWMNTEKVRTKVVYEHVLGTSLPNLSSCQDTTPD